MQTSYELISWNVNGIRAAEKKAFLPWLSECRADIICLQETKAHPEQLSGDLLHPNGFESYWNSASKKGYSGTCVYTKPSPVLAVTHFGEPLLDEEGRIVLLEYESFYLFNVYFPNGGRGPHRLEYKLRFYDRFLKLMQAYRKQKPIVLCGDINTAHTEIDLARPKENMKTTGFLPIEREWIDTLIDRGYIDTFRMFHSEGDRYTYWDQITRARERNVGWRIDYFFVSKELQSNVIDADILESITGSDHCPIRLRLRF